MVAERVALRFDKEQNSRKYMTGDAGEQSSRIPGTKKPTRISLSPDVLGSMLKEPRYRNGICVAQA